MFPSNITNKYTELHASPKGPGDARPSAFQILKDNDRIGNLGDKTFLITGGTDGLGRETVRQLAKTGAKVWFTARNKDKANKVVNELLTEEGMKGAKIDFVIADNTSLTSVKTGAEEFLEKSGQLNVLICNAGISYTPYKRTEDGHEAHFATNHLAHFYFFQLLQPLLLKSSTPAFHSRVVTVSSIAHNLSSVHVGNYDFCTPLAVYVDPQTELPKSNTDVGYYNPFIAYGQSKTANIWMANEIERKFGKEGLHGLSVHPGNILTAGYGSMDLRCQEKFAPFLSVEMFQNVIKSLEQGAATQVLASVGKDFEGRGGLYLEDCAVATEILEGTPMGIAGYRSWAYDREGAERLWADSLEMVRVKV